jgi:hypothetical protein
LARATAPQSPALIPALQTTTLHLLRSCLLHLESRSPIVTISSRCVYKLNTVHFGGANMPIFQDDDEGLAHEGPPPEQQAETPPRSTTPLESVPMGRKLSEESIRTELCEGPLPDSLEDLPSYSTRGLNSCFASPLHGTSDRLDYIERLKRGESPTWFPNRNVSEIFKYGIFQITNCSLHLAGVATRPR